MREKMKYEKNLMSMKEVRKRTRGKEINKIGKLKTNRKMVDTNQIISAIAARINSPNTLIQT
jgi:hypothetical protein